MKLLQALQQARVPYATPVIRETHCGDEMYEGERKIIFISGCYYADELDKMEQEVG